MLTVLVPLSIIERTHDLWLAFPMVFRAFKPIRNAALGLGASFSVLYAWDNTFNRRAISRTAYAFYNAGIVAIDYKYSFREGHDIDALHERCAKRLYNVIVNNKGLYVKIGQSIAVQGGLLPAPYKEILSRLYDDAPQDTWEECLTTLKASLGQDLGNIFSDLNEQAVASASIAQVHKGTLRSTGKEVAVKIQHSDIPTSTYWDLGSYKVLMWMFDKFVFSMPLYFVARYIADQVQEETDFNIELKNTQTMRQLIESDSYMRNKIYVPRVYPEYSSERVLVMEWIEGASLSRKKDVIDGGFDVKSALTNVFKVLTKEAFEWGVVHSDPHPGNWILRRDPNNLSRQQLVMLDHGLYVYMGTKLRDEYAQLWRAMFKKDIAEITRITKEWGFGDPKLFASATMLQPYDEDSRVEKSNFESEELRAERVRNFLKDTDKIPLELVFVGRTQRILQGLNQLYGSPVNRMRILVDEALKIPASSTELGGDWRFPITFRVMDWLYKRLLLVVADLYFAVLRIKQVFDKQDPECAFDESIQKNGMAILK